MSKGRNDVVWSRNLKCILKPCVIGPLTKCYFNEFLFMQVLTDDKIEYMSGCERLECHGLPDFVFDLPPRGDFEKQSK